MPAGFFTNALKAHEEAAPALMTSATTVDYGELNRRIDAFAALIDRPRCLVLLIADNSVETIVSYLSALRAGHVVLPVAAQQPDVIAKMISAYDPDLVIWPSSSTASSQLAELRHSRSVHRLHPDLALLLSTSGSTGSPKLVRLSYENLQSNAEAIAEYLDIRAADRAMTSLPLHYCYGLSVVHSHLLRGASLVVTDRSVTESQFWELFEGKRATSFAGVPYTFDLLDRVGFQDMTLPSLRYVTQAGGRLEPDRVRDYAALGHTRGWDLFVMYGQTEATARMAYLPPGLATTHPQAIGIPIAGGAFRLEPADDSAEAHELVYTGPNVMLGYASGPADLAVGRTTHELRTGDLAKLNEDGLYEIVGRRSRFLKLFGLRVDLLQVELAVAQTGVEVAATGTDLQLLIAAKAPANASEIRELVTGRFGLPAHSVAVHVLEELPRLASGKPDYLAIRELAEAAQRQDTNSSRTEEAIVQLYASMLGMPDVVSSDTFIDIGGDSMTFVAMAVSLEKLIGNLPANWPSMPIHELARKRRRRWVTMDTSVLLRAVSIILIIGTHLKMFVFPGGAQILLGVAGYSLARFHLTPSTSPADRGRQILRSVLRIWLPAAVWIAAVLIVFGDSYSPVNLIMANYLVGTDNARAEWHFWFLETLIYYLIACAALFTTPWGDRIERRYPFALPAVLMSSGPVIAIALNISSPSQYNRLTPVLLLWFFAIGWAAAKATSVWHRLGISAVIVTTVPSFILYDKRAALAMAGLLLLTWVKTVPSLRLVNVAVSSVAGASLYIYLTHWQLMPRLEQRGFPALATLAGCVVFGIAFAEAVRRTPDGGLLARLTRKPHGPVSTRTVESSPSR